MTGPLRWILLGIIVALHAGAALPVARRLRRRGGQPRLVVGLTAGMWAVGVLLWLGFVSTDLALEHDAAVLWVLVCAAATLAGFIAAVRANRMPIAELALAGVLTVEGAAALTVVTRPDVDLASAPVRALLVAPAALALFLYFGASLGLLVGSRHADRQLGFESMIGRRFLLSKSSGVLSTVTAISVIGVTLGVWLVLVSLGVLAGFETDLRQKIIGANAHIVVQEPTQQAFPLRADMLESARQLPAVAAASPVLESEVALASESNFGGGLMFGIDPERAPEVLTVLNQLTQGSLEALGAPQKQAASDQAAEFAPPAPIPKAVLGVELAKTLNVRVGDTIRVISPTLEVLTPLGTSPRSLGFEVAGIFTSEMYEFDARYMFVSLSAARRFMQLGPRAVNGIQVRVHDPQRTERAAARLLAALGRSDFEAQDWKQRNQTLFSALKLERVVAFIVLVFIILVASFSIVNTLSMSVIEKRREIAILKTIGARDLSVMKVFLLQGMLVGGVGTLFGTLLAIVTVVALETYGFSIPGNVYYIEALPVHMAPIDVVLVVLAAGLIVWNFAVFPALRGAQLEPVEGLRDG